MNRLLSFFVAVLVSGVSSMLWAESTPAEVVQEIRFDQRLGQNVPLQVPLIDESGRAVTLAQYALRGPIILNLVYYGCPSLCTEVLNGLLRALRVLSLAPGRDFTVVTLSFDPKETSTLAAQKGDAYRRKYERPVTPEGWAFLTAKPESIRAITDAVGFHYVYDPKTEQYAHAAGLVVLTPEGKVSRYLFGVEYSPKELRLALGEAADGKIGGLAEQILLYCYRYDPATGRYGLAIMRLVRTGGLLTLVALATFIGLSLRRERKANLAA